MKRKGNTITPQKPLNYTDYVMDLGNLSLDEIVGQDEAIAELKTLVESIKYKTIYNIWKVKSAKGIMLIGGTGLGKTASVRALAKELSNDVILMELRYLDIASRWIDAPIEHLKQFFKIAEIKSKEKHVLIFIDELDSMLPDRESGNLHETSVKRVDVFLEWMDGGLGTLENITLIGATNFEYGVDRAAKRPGRFDKLLQYKDLDSDAVIKGLKIHLEKKDLNDTQIEDIDWDLIRQKSKLSNITGADLPEIINRLITCKINEHISNLQNKINFDDLDVDEKDVQIYNTEYYPDRITTDDFINQINKYVSYKNKGKDYFVGFSASAQTS